MNSDTVTNDYNQGLDNYYERQEQDKLKKEQELYETLLVSVTETKSKVYEYIMQIDYWKKQIYMVPDSFKNVLNNAIFQHSMMISRLYKFRSMLELTDYREVIRGNAQIDQVAITQIIRRFGSNLDLLKNIQIIIRKEEDSPYRPQSFYYDLKKLRKNAADLYNILDF
jgi:hypothetical protein